MTEFEVVTVSPLTMSASIASIIPAFIEAKKAMGPLVKGASNPFFKSKYADLGSVIDVSETALLENGIATIQSPGGDGHNVSVTTLFAHVSGEWIQGHLVLAPIKPDPQAAGSAITYARRYSLQAMCNLAAEDDDGNAAVKARLEPVAPRTARPAASPPPNPQRVRAAELLDALPPDRRMAALAWASNNTASELFQLSDAQVALLVPQLLKGAGTP